MAGYWNAVPWGQVGETSSRGIEFSLNWAKNFGQDWRLEARANFTYVKNQFDYYDEPDYSQPWTSRVGRPLDDYYMWGYVADGLFVDQADIDNHAEQQLGSTVRPETPFSDNPYFATGAGGMLQAVINGFCGLEITDKGVVQLPAALPPHWKSVTVKGVGPDRKTYVNTGLRQK